MRSLAEVVPLRPTPCQRAAASLPALAAGEELLGALPAGHVERCGHCRAELAIYRRLLGELRALRATRREPPADALAELLRVLAAQPSSGAQRALRAVYLGGITVATAAAGAAGVLVWINRRRPGLARAS